jgi:hypothetical protein
LQYPDSDPGRQKNNKKRWFQELDVPPGELEASTGVLKSIYGGQEENMLIFLKEKLLT